MSKRIAERPTRKRHFIAEWRRYRNLTQERLAERLETTKASISRIENGEQAYTQHTLEALAEALACDPGDLLVRNPEDPEGIWSIWDKARPGERQQIVEIAKTLVKTRNAR